MPYHIKTPATLGSGDLYYKGDNHWTNVYADREQYSAKATADSQAAEAYSRIEYSVNKPYHIKYQPIWWKNSTVVTE